MHLEHFKNRHRPCIIHDVETGDDESLFTLRICTHGLKLDFVEVGTYVRVYDRCIRPDNFFFFFFPNVSLSLLVLPSFIELISIRLYFGNIDCYRIIWVFTRLDATFF